MSRVRGALLLAAIVFVLDQAIKYAAVNTLGYISATRELLPIFRLTLVPNCGISLGLLGDYTDSVAVRGALVALTACISIAVAVWLWREPKPADRLALGLVLGGAIGNICDRVIPAGTLGKITHGPVGYPGCVIDYADLHFGEFRPFLVFNLADAAITIGVLILLARALLVRDKPADVSENANA